MTHPHPSISVSGVVMSLWCRPWCPLESPGVPCGLTSQCDHTSVVSARHWLSLVTCELTEDWRWWRAGGAETLQPDTVFPHTALVTPHHTSLLLLTRRPTSGQDLANTQSICQLDALSPHDCHHGLSPCYCHQRSQFSCKYF